MTPRSAGAASLLVPVFLSLALALSADAAAQRADTLRISGLRAPVEVLRDAWGIAHIYATNEHDLFFAQGYTAARDRAFQFEIWRRQATGTVAELLGERELKRDIGARLFKYRGSLAADLAHYHPRGAAIVGAFVDGVNAYVDEAARNPALVPLELKLLGIKPGRWTPEVVISRHQGLLGNITEELNYGRFVARHGADLLKRIEWFHPGPGQPALDLDPSIDKEGLFEPILDLYNAYRAPVRFQPADVQSAYRGSEEGWRRLAALRAEDDSVLAWNRRRDIGSNNWVVGPRLSLNGRAIMANDPHRAQSAPSLRYFVHLVAPGWNVIGGGEPTVPGVSIGHNEYGAWGLTIFSTDGEDLYVYKVNPANRSQYRYRGAWESMRTVRETIPVKGRGAETVTLKYTRHGPVVYEDTVRGVAYAVRAAWMEPGGGPVHGVAAHGPGEDVGGVPRGVFLLEHPRREHDLGRREGEHRVAGGGDRPHPSAFERAGPRSGRRALRVGRVPTDPQQASCLQPRRGIHRDREQQPDARGLSVPRRHRMVVGRPVSLRAHHRGAGLREARLDDRHDEAAERLHVAPRARARPAPGRVEGGERGGGACAHGAAGVGPRARPGVGGGGDLRGLVPAAGGEHPGGGRPRQRARDGAGDPGQADHRLADCAWRGVRRRPHGGTRQRATEEPGRGGAGADASLRRRHGGVEVGELPPGEAPAPHERRAERGAAPPVRGGAMAAWGRWQHSRGHRRRREPDRGSLVPDDRGGG